MFLQQINKSIWLYFHIFRFQQNWLFEQRDFYISWTESQVNFYPVLAVNFRLTFYLKCTVPLTKIHQKLWAVYFINHQHKFTNDTLLPKCQFYLWLIAKYIQFSFKSTKYTADEWTFRCDLSPIFCSLSFVKQNFEKNV